MSRMSQVVAAIVALLVLASAPASADTNFTYQGVLEENGNAAEGPYAMSFSLWDALAAGNQIGTTITLANVSVADGKFTVELDYGGNSFDNTGRWLEIVVEGVTLSPRNPITSAPYSIQTRGIFVNDAGQIGIGTTTPQRELDVEAEDPVIRLTATDPTAGVAARLQFKGSAGPPIFHPFGIIEFYDDLDELRATIRTTAAGSGAASLYLNVAPEGLAQMSIHESGVQFENQIKPPIAYGKVDFSGFLRSGSTNITMVQHLPPVNSGTYVISFAEPLLETDIVHATLQEKGLVTARVTADGNVVVNTFSHVTAHPESNLGFSIVVYRP